MHELRKAKKNLENMNKPFYTQAEAMCDVPYILLLKYEISPGMSKVKSYTAYLQEFPEEANCAFQGDNEK